jgi:ABC-type nitrate/sulfonate/bicarbonate transport system substrate-binding protein
MLINAGANPISAFVEAQTKAAEWLAQHPELAKQSLIIRPGRSA